MTFTSHMAAAAAAISSATPTSIAAEIDILIEHFRGANNQAAADRLASLRARLDALMAEEVELP